MHPRIQRIVTGSLFAGLEIQFLGEGIELNLIILKRKGQQLIVEKSISAIESIEKLPEHLAKDIPMTIAFTGKGVLQRRVAVDPGSDPKILLSKILPNASLKEFYMQIIPASRDEQFISILRKPAVDEILERLSQFSIVACSFGPLSVITTLSLFDEPRTELRFGRHSIQLSNNELDEVNYGEENPGERYFELGGQKVEAENLLAFASAFQQILNGQEFSSAHVESLVSAKEEFLQRKLFKTGGMALLAVVLFLLIGNYFAFSHYWSEKSQLESKLQTDGGAFTDLRKLEKQVQAKRDFLEQAGLLNRSNNSFYADRIASGLPEEILLTRMALAPRLKLSEEDSIGFRPGYVEIDGTCSESIVLNKWLQELKGEKWIRSATLESYVQDKTMKQGEFQVALELE